VDEPDARSSSAILKSQLVSTPPVKLRMLVESMKPALSWFRMNPPSTPKLKLATVVSLRVTVPSVGAGSSSVMLPLRNWLASSGEKARSVNGVPV
jgi:hypothetical protein